MGRQPFLIRFAQQSAQHNAGMRYALPLLALSCALLAAPAHALLPGAEEWVWEYEEAEWSEAPAAGTSGRFVSEAAPEQHAAAATYGPFRVIDGSRAALVGITDHRSPRDFAAMLRDHPGLAMLELVECPGTFDDIANLELGRMIRRAGLATHVPRKGSVRSGAVELFLAGTSRSIEDGARFAVHSWEDDSGREAFDYAITAPENRRYITYYLEMGMSNEQAHAFYAMTNSVPFSSARWLSASEMRGWAGLEDMAGQRQAGAMQQAEPRLSYLDLGALLN